MATNDTPRSRPVEQVRRGGRARTTRRRAARQSTTERGRDFPDQHLRDRVAAVGRRRLDVRAGSPGRLEQRRLSDLTSGGRPGGRCGCSARRRVRGAAGQRPHDQHRGPAASATSGPSRPRSSPRNARYQERRRRGPARSSTRTDTPRLRPHRHRRQLVRRRARGRRHRGAALPRWRRTRSRRRTSYWHLDVPADVSLGCNADRAHRAGITGRGIRVAMVDSGWQPHPFFTDRGYRVEPDRARARAPPTRRSTRTATAPASRPTSSPPRRTSTCCR